MTFALGVATGIPLQFSLGTNWARYSRFVGDVFGSVLGAEGFFAFLVEAGFLGILLFGWHKVSSKVHFISTICVAFGAHFSAIWIVTANSWMQSPTGYRLTTDSDGVPIAQVTDWWAMVLSPTNLNAISHVILGAWLAGSFLIVSVSAYYLWKKKYHDFAVKSMKVGLAIAATSVLLQLISGDRLAGIVAKVNPEKFAALEGVFETEPYTPINVVGWVDTKNEKVYGIKIPGILSYLSYHEFEKPVPGLKEFPKEEWPVVQLVFQVYHIMVLMWGLMFIGAGLGVYFWWKNNWKMNKLTLKFLMFSVLFPQIANISGWYTTCFGRQPWTVYKLLKTSEGFTNSISEWQIIGSLTMFLCMYFLFFGLFIYLLNRKIKHGPSLEDEESTPYRDIFKTEAKKS